MWSKITLTDEKNGREIAFSILERIDKPTPTAEPEEKPEQPEQPEQKPTEQEQQGGEKPKPASDGSGIA